MSDVKNHFLSFKEGFCEGTYTPSKSAAYLWGACCLIVILGSLLYPHKAVAGGAWLDGKTIIATFMFTAFALYASGCLAKNRPLVAKTPLNTQLAALTVLVCFAAIFAQNRPTAIEAVTLYFAYLCCFTMYLFLAGSSQVKIILVYLILAIGIFLSLFGLYYWYFFNLRIDGVWRLRATFGNSNQMAGYLSMIIPLYVSMMFSRKFSKKSLLGLYGIVILLITALLFTYARGGWISALVGIIFVLVVQQYYQKHNTRKLMTFAGSLGTLCFIILISSTSLVLRFITMTQQEAGITLQGRLQAWQGTIEMIAANLISGVGPGNYADAFRPFTPPGTGVTYYFAHNDYLHFISEVGIFLIPILIVLMYTLFTCGFSRLKSENTQQRSITIGAMGGIIAMLIYSVSDFNLHIPANALLFIVLAAMVAAPGEKNVGRKEC